MKSRRFLMSVFWILSLFYSTLSFGAVQSDFLQIHSVVPTKVVVMPNDFYIKISADTETAEEVVNLILATQGVTACFRQDKYSYEVWIGEAFDARQVVNNILKRMNFNQISRREWRQHKPRDGIRKKPRKSE